MQIAHSLAELEPFPSVVTIGNFDGVHCGHRMVIAAVLERARALHARSVAITFDPHPAHVLHDGPRLRLITPLAQKLDLLSATGLDMALVLPFTEEFRCWTARQFAERVLRDTLRAVEVHEGETFRFGHQAEADISALTDLGHDLGYRVQAYHPRIGRGAGISSSRIRSLIAAGDLSQARALLGRSFSVRSTPAPGRGYGTRYAVPTINLAEYPELLPAHGVYVTSLTIGNGASARVFRGVTNVGNRPTFGPDSFAVETHLLDFEPIALTESTPLELTFLHHLRPERRFESPEALRAQIGLDVKKAQRYFALASALAVAPSQATAV
jgi:riboflavin kinase/FMN adenylyltransferase